jgi:hypothetical protein
MHDTLPAGDKDEPQPHQTAAILRLAQRGSKLFGRVEIAPFAGLPELYGATLSRGERADFH